MLTENLRDLELCCVINRKSYPIAARKVEYSLTDKGMDLKGVLDMMQSFGEKYKNEKK